MMIPIRKAWEILREALALPRVTVHLGTAPEGVQMRQEFAAAHPKFPLVGRKQLGACLIDLRYYKDFNAYLSGAGGNRSAALRLRQRDARHCAQAMRSGRSVRQTIIAS